MQKLTLSTALKCAPALVKASTIKIWPFFEAIYNGVI